MFKIDPLLLDDKADFIESLIEVGYKFAIDDFKFADQTLELLKKCKVCNSFC